VAKTSIVSAQRAEYPQELPYYNVPGLTWRDNANRATKTTLSGAISKSRQFKVLNATKRYVHDLDMFPGYILKIDFLGHIPRLGMLAHMPTATIFFTGMSKKLEFFDLSQE